MDKLLKERVGEMIGATCKDLNVILINLNIYESSVEMTVEAPPNLSPYKLVTHIKNNCNKKALENEFIVLQKMPNIWTRNCLMSTHTLSIETIESYKLAQKSK